MLIAAANAIEAAPLTNLLRVRCRSYPVTPETASGLCRPGAKEPLMKEDWRDIPGINCRFQVSNLGGLRTKAYIDKRGWHRKAQLLKYEELYIVINGKRTWFCRAGLILLAFVGPPPKGCYLSRHLNDDRSDNRIENLAWGNDQDNHNDAVKNGANYTSYGFLGKHWSEKQRAAYRAKFLGVPSGRTMSPDHKAAMLAGYRKKFPEKKKPKPKRCNCGCGELTVPGNQFIRGHAGRVRFRQIAKDRIGKPRAW